MVVVVAKLCSIKLDLNSKTHWLVDRCPAWKSPQMSGLENLTDYAGPGVLSLSKVVWKRWRGIDMLHKARVSILCSPLLFHAAFIINKMRRKNSNWGSLVNHTWCFDD